MAPYKTREAGRPSTDYDFIRRAGLFPLKQNSWYGLEQYD